MYIHIQTHTHTRARTHVRDTYIYIYKLYGMTNLIMDNDNGVEHILTMRFNYLIFFKFATLVLIMRRKMVTARVEHR